MASLRARGMRRLARRMLKTEKSGPDEVVAHFRGVLDRAPALAPVPRGVARRPVEPGELGGVKEITGEWVGTPAAGRALLHHHGGAYVSGRPTNNVAFAGRLAKALRADVLLAGYRLAPEHAYPAALDDAVRTYTALVERFPPGAVAVSGDSAGGGLTLALLQRIRDDGLPPPAAAVLLSPWADLTDDAPSRSANHEADDMLTGPVLTGAAQAYLQGADPREPGASPALADLAGLPPILVLVDDSEVLLDDSLRIVEGVQAAGGEALLIRRSGLFHVWPVLVPLVPEAAETTAEIAGFLDERLARP